MLYVKALIGGLVALVCVCGSSVFMAPVVGAEELYRCDGLSPVLLIHGLKSTPEIWGESELDYVSWLKGLGYSEDIVGLYQYSGSGPVEGSYNNQGGVAEVSTGMRQAVLDLREASLACGGDGLVTLVAHSMGGLVARYYLSEWPDEHGVRRVISVGTPYLGSWMLTGVGGYSENAGRGEEVLRELVGPMLGLGGLDLDEPAYEDLSPGSELQDRLLELEPNEEVDFHVLYGNIQARLSMRLFHITVMSQRIGLGDLVVGVASATELGKQEVADQVGFLDEWSLGMSMSLRFGNGVAWLEYAVFEGLSTKYWHNSLMGETDVKQKIGEILKRIWLSEVV